MGNKAIKIGLAVITFIVSLVEAYNGGKNLIDSIRETPEEEKTEENVEESE